MKLKYKNIFSIILAFLFSSALNLHAQSADLMKSVPIYGKAPVSVIPTVTLNGPTPLEVIGNPFSQPNIQEYLGRGKLDWYGSGDVNDDEKIDSMDVAAIDTSKNDRADIDGDGVPGTQKDKQILLDYLNEKIPYLPGHWNELTTREERISWLEKMIKIDTTNNILSTNSNWICGDRTTQEQINFFGLSNAGEFVKNNKTYGGKDFSLKMLGRFNVPIYIVGDVANNSVAHSVLTCLVGNKSGDMSPLNFDNFYYWSAYNDSKIFPGDFEMNANGPVSISLEAYWQNPISHELQFAFIPDIIRFNLKNGIATLDSVQSLQSDGTWKRVPNYGWYLTLHNPNIIKVHVGKLEKLFVDSGKFLDGTALMPEFLQSHGYKAIPDTSKNNTTLQINLSYFDSDTVKLSNTHYTISRKFYAWIYSGGLTKVDSTTLQIEVDKVTSVEENGNKIPQAFVLYQNYPNPFNPTTTIKFSIPSVGA